MKDAYKPVHETSCQSNRLTVVFPEPDDGAAINNCDKFRIIKLFMLQI